MLGQPLPAYAQKAIRDFWLERTRTVFVVLAIAMGIAAFAAVLSSYAILTRDLNQEYLATNPASATLITNEIDDALLREVAADPSVGAVEARRVVRGRIKSGPAEWRNLTLFVVKDFGAMRIAKVAPEKGAWPPATGELLIERDAFQVAHARIGDSVRIRIVGSTEYSLHVSGGVHDVGQAQARMENSVYGYITPATLAGLGEKPYLDRLNILVANDGFNEEHIRRVAAGVRKTVEGRGHRVRRVDIPTPGKHPHADIMGLLLLAMSGGGFLILLLSGILVVNLLTALMASQTPQIGVMKAMGGTREQIGRIYFAQALLLGAAAILVALPVGAWGSRQLCRALALLLNFDITSFAPPVWIYLLVAAVGLAVPLLAAASPVWKGCGISVREALADSGTSSQMFGTSAFDRALAGMTGLARPLLLAIRNGFRRRTRLVLTLATLSAAGLFFLSALNIRASLINTLDNIFALKRYDLSVRLGGMYSNEKLERAVRNTPGIVRSEGWILVEGSIPGVGDDAPASAAHGDTEMSGGHFEVVALPAGTKFLQLNIAEGRGLVPGDTNAVVVNNALASRGAEIKPGSTITLRLGTAQLKMQVVGVANEPFSPPVAYIPKEYVEAVGNHYGMANSLLLVLDRTDPVAIASVKASLDRNLEQESLRASGSASKAESRYGFDQHMLMLYVFLIVVSCILAGVGGLGLMTTLSLNVLERRREMGVLRAMGAPPLAVWLIVVTEGLVIGILSWALAVLAAWPLSTVLGNMLLSAVFNSRPDFRFELSGVLIWLAVSVVLGFVAGSLPAWQASRLTVREALAHA